MAKNINFMKSKQLAEDNLYTYRPKTVQSKPDRLNGRPDQYQFKLRNINCLNVRFNEIMFMSRNPVKSNVNKHSKVVTNACAFSDAVFKDVVIIGNVWFVLQCIALLVAGVIRFQCSSAKKVS